MIKLKDLLSEKKFEMKGKYLYMPGGAVTSIPKRNEREKLILQIKNHKYQLHTDGGQYMMWGGRYGAREFIGKEKDLIKFLNKNKAKYIGIDRQ